MKRAILLTILMVLAGIATVRAELFKNVASQKLIMYARDTASNVPKRGDSANITVRYSLDGGTVTALADTSATEVNAVYMAGAYIFDLSQAETNGNLIIYYGNSTTNDVNVIPLIVYTSAQYRQVDVVYWDGNSIPAGADAGVPKVNIGQWTGTTVATPDAAGYPKVTIKSGTGTGEISLSSGRAKADVVYWDGNDVPPANAAGWPQVDFCRISGSVTAVDNITLVYDTDFADDYNDVTNTWRSDVNTVLGEEPVEAASRFDTLDASIDGLRADVNTANTEITITEGYALDAKTASELIDTRDKLLTLLTGGTLDLATEPNLTTILGRVPASVALHTDPNDALAAYAPAKESTLEDVNNNTEALLVAIDNYIDTEIATLQTTIEDANNNTQADINNLSVHGDNNWGPGAVPSASENAEAVWEDPNVITAAAIAEEVWEDPNAITSGAADRILATTVAAVTDSSAWTLTAGSATTNEYENALIFVTDASDGTIAMRWVQAYIGATKTIVVHKPLPFTPEAGDTVIIAPIMRWITYSD